MSEPKKEGFVGADSIGLDFRVIEGPGNTTRRLMSDIIAELREEARKRREQEQQQQQPPPKEEGEPGKP